MIFDFNAGSFVDFSDNLHAVDITRLCDCDNIIQYILYVHIWHGKLGILYASTFDRCLQAYSFPVIKYGKGLIGALEKKNQPSQLVYLTPGI